MLRGIAKFGIKAKTWREYLRKQYKECADHRARVLEGAAKRIIKEKKSYRIVPGETTEKSGNENSGY